MANGFNVRSAPGAAGGAGGYQAGGYQQAYPDQQPHYGSYQEYERNNPKTLEEENIRKSTATRHMWFGVIEIGVGLGSNFGQIITTFFSFIQIMLGVNDTTLQNSGLSAVVGSHPAFVWVALVMGIGSQILLQAGCQILSHSWKKERQLQMDAGMKESQRRGVVDVLMSKEAGWFFTGLGFVMDAVGDLGFAIAFGIPWYVCLLFGLLMNGLSTYVLYDGDERFHFSYPIWWTARQAKKLWKQAALESARLRHGVSPDGRSLIRR
jgi:hypothetical protein